MFESDTYETHEHDEERQLEVLHTHGPGEVSTCGLKCDWLVGANLKFIDLKSVVQQKKKSFMTDNIQAYRINQIFRLVNQQL